MAPSCWPSLRTQAIDWANLIAPEHLTTTREKLPGIVQRGFDFSWRLFGASCRGLWLRTQPRAADGGVRVFVAGSACIDFLKVITVQELSRAGLRKIAPSIVTLAEAEGLQAHAQSIELRCGHA